MKHIIVTGVSQGIGLEVVKQYLAFGNCKVIALGRNPHLVKERTAGFDPSNFKALYLDLNDPDFKELITTVNEFFNGSVDVLLNNAGYLVNKAFTEISNTDIDLSFNVNFKGPFMLIQCLLSYFREGGHIVNITSMGAVTGTSKFPGLAAYSSTKGALTILTELLAVELKPRLISVNGLALGAVQTEMLQNAFPDYQAPLSPEAIAPFITSFSLTGMSFFNGKVLPVNLCSLLAEVKIAHTFAPAFDSKFF
jgi:NAD(P)-dependent dehydrogenase (short-subunit alcohol dehydrogenase family)